MTKFDYFKQSIEPSIQTIAMQRSTGDEFEKQWIRDRLRDPHLCDIIDQLSIINMHTLKAIATNHLINGVELSSKLGVTRSTISKSTKRLVDFGLIRYEQTEDNQKERHYCITDTGKIINLQHEALETYIEKQIHGLINDFPEDSLETVAKFLRGIAEIHP